MKTNSITDKPLRKDMFLLIDTSAFFYRALFAMKDFTGDDLRGLLIKHVLEEMFELCNTFSTKNLVFLFDSKTSLRKAIYPEYKAKRPVPTTPEEIERFRVMQQTRAEFRKEILPKLGFNNVFIRKGLESDDLIAAITQEWLGDFVIVTSDKDLWQCLAVNVRWLSVATGELVTLRGFKEKTGLNSPYDWVKVKMFGCVSDNVKGIPGIAEPSAIKYVRGVLTGGRFNKCVTNEAKAIRKRNKVLVKLPFKPLSLRYQDEKFNPEGFCTACRELGLKGLRKQVGEWEHHFIARK